MTQTMSSRPGEAGDENRPTRPHGRRLWQLAGALAVAHVALMMGGLALQEHALFADGVPGIRSAYAEGDLARTIAGGMVESVGFLALLPVLVFLSTHLGRSSEAGRWAARTALAAGVGYVTVTLAVGFPAGAAAMYGAQNGLDLDVAFALNNLRVFAYFLSLGLLGVHAIGVGLAARQDRFLPRWAGVGGIVTGVVLLASLLASTIGLQDLGTLVWLVWWLGLAVGLVRHDQSGR
jgi:hypothetical protein